MRTLIAVLSIFLALCAAIGTNFKYINETADELIEMTEALSISGDDCLKRIDEIEKKVGEERQIFSLSVGSREIDYLGETLLMLRITAEQGNALEFERYRALLIDAIDGVCRLEKFSVMNIL